jgi:hypothetical protein
MAGAKGDNSKIGATRLDNFPIVDAKKYSCLVAKWAGDGCFWWFKFSSRSQHWH